MRRFAIKKLPLNIPGMYTKVEKPMSVRYDLGEFEVEAESVEDARRIASLKVRDDEPNMICEWSEKYDCFVRSHNKEFVHPVRLFKFDGNHFSEAIGTCRSDRPDSGRFLKKSDAKNDYYKCKKLANKKINEALEHLRSVKKLGVLDFHIDGDTHGIHEEYMYFQVREGAYTFTHKLS